MNQMNKLLNEWVSPYEWFLHFSPSHIKGVDVFLERAQTRQHVGVLDMWGQKFRFVYDDAYLKAQNILKLGPEFPLTCKEFAADKLFPSLADRLPDPDNPAYDDYCISAGIAVTTTDPIVLLATIGKRGPSSFIFEPIYEANFSFDECEKWRKQLGLSMQDFANFFEVSLSSLQKIKAGSSSGRDVLQRLELYWRVPEALEYQLEKQKKWLHRDKMKKVMEFCFETRYPKDH